MVITGGENGKPRREVDYQHLIILIFPVKTSTIQKFVLYILLVAILNFLDIVAMLHHRNFAMVMNIKQIN